ncbi:Sps2p [Saccharomyces paradoxus]|uniref:Sps2p n=1 Tax=Saccharomyces paradoxus TaxID=27291 RepID=A0A8B8UPN1_SACPA|nr:Sps2 [Saccharomyces paradoxus]QHS72695.1 Sps2 [Saccharomyces paradoxus]
MVNKETKVITDKEKDNMLNQLNTILSLLFLFLQLTKPSTAFEANGELNILDHNIMLVNTNATVPKKEKTNFETISPTKQTKIDEDCKKSLYHIENAANLIELQAKCWKVVGNIEISSNFSGSLIDLGSIKEIEGDLIIKNNKHVFRIQGYNLESLQKLELDSLTSFVSLDLPVLKEVETVDWRVLPILSSVVINGNIKKIKNIIISDTALTSIDYFNNVKEVDIFNINNNRFLETLFARLESVTKQLTVHSNAKELELDLSNLYTVENMTIKDVSTIKVAKLSSVNSSLEFIENQFSSLELPLLAKVQGTLGLIDNKNLKKLNFSNVTDIQGGLMIANNTELAKIDFFPKLRQIGGAIYFEGSFEKIDLPELKLVKGSAYIKSSSDELNCEEFTTPKNGRSIIRGGKIECTSGMKSKMLNVDEEGNVLGKQETDNNDGKKEKGKNGAKSQGSSKKMENSAPKNTFIDAFKTSIYTVLTILFAIVF